MMGVSKRHWLAALLGAASVGLCSVGRAGEQVPPASFADKQRMDKLTQALPELDRIARRWVEAHHVPGLAWGVIIDGRLARFGSAGARDLEGKQPIDADTVFRIASMTKSFTALAILMLRDEGKLELDAPVSRYVPEMANLVPATRDSGPITIRHLLTHTAGFPEDNPWGDRQMAMSDAELSARLTSGVPFSTATGSAYEYSNYGFAILGRVVTNVSGMRYIDFVNRRILAPLEMTSSWWDAKDVPANRLAVGYHEQDEKFIPEVPLGDGAFGPMGGLFTSSNDLTRWIAFMLDAFPPRDDVEKAPALRRSVREMQQGAGFPTLSAHGSAFGAPVEATAGVYAFGLRVARTCDGLRVMHRGGFPGFGSVMLWLPEHGVGVFSMINLTYTWPDAMLSEMLTMLSRTGGLKPRQAAASPALVAMTRQVGDLLDEWSDARANALAANNLFLDESLERRRNQIRALRKDLGSCSRAPIEATNALRGRFRMNCERGWLNVDFTLAPTQPPTVQYLEVTSGRPLQLPMQQAVAAVLDGMARGPQSLDLARSVDRNAVGAVLGKTRESYGTCRMDAPLQGDGETHALVRMMCTLGPLDLEIRRSEGKITSVGFAPPSNLSCTP